jgi:hypothetical protein
MTKSITKLLAICSLMSLISLAARAADAPAPVSSHAALDPTIADLVKLAGEGRADQMLLRIGPIPDDERDATERTREYLVNLYANGGKYSGYDIAGVKQLTPRFQIAYVLVYFEKRPVLFEFGFYQVDGVWRPQTFRVESDFKSLLDTMPLQK